MARSVQLLALAALASARLVTINNTAPRLDVNGVPMDAHDCSVRLLPNGTYVMHAIEYGLCVAPTGQGCDSTPDHCGFRDTHNVTVWTSPDLSSGSWTRAGYAFALQDRPAGLIFRPDAIYNPNTGLWVLWYNQATVSACNCAISGLRRGNTRRPSVRRLELSCLILFCPSPAAWQRVHFGNVCLPVWPVLWLYHDQRDRRRLHRRRLSPV